MISIFEQAMGEEFTKLHPKMQKRFGVNSGSLVAQMGKGVMDEIWRGPFFIMPFLAFGAFRSILFPMWRKRNTDVPFTISNYAYVDGLGRETVTISRRFRLPHRVRSFDANMIYSKKRKKVIDYIGTHQHLAVDIDLSVDEVGGLCLRAGEQRFYEHKLAFRFPFFLTGQANVREWWDENEEKYRIEVRITNKLLGNVFGYRGSFTVQEVSNRAVDIPLEVRPFREEVRD